MILVKYFTTWFSVDIVSIIPFDLIYTFGNFNKISRFSRIGKIYKLIRMLKIVRLIKIIKINNTIARHLAEYLKINAATERLMYLVLLFFVL